jgi:hypothetical protein
MPDLRELEQIHDTRKKLTLGSELRREPQLGAENTESHVSGGQIICLATGFSNIFQPLKITIKNFNADMYHVTFQADLTGLLLKMNRNGNLNALMCLCILGWNVT